MRAQHTTWDRVHAVVGLEPRVLERVPLLPASRLFAEVVAAGERLLDRSGEQRSKLYVDGKATASDLRAWLPRRQDGDVAGWHRRISVRDARAILFFTGDMPLSIRSEALRALRHHLGEAIPTSGAAVNMEVFLGRYDFTAGGIHAESGSNLHAIVDGDKTMLLWPPDAWDRDACATTAQRDPGSGEYEVFLTDVDPAKEAPRAWPLRGRSGDLLSWTDGWWHIGRAVRPCLSFSLTFNRVDP